MRAPSSTWRASALTLAVIAAWMPGRGAHTQTVNMPMPAAASRPAPAPAKPMADMPGMDMPTPPAKDADPTGMRGMEGMDMAGMGMDHGGHAMMAGELGAYPMTRDTAGTAWQPDSAPHEGLHGQYGAWKTMLHGYATLIDDRQGGPRGEDKTFVQSHFMGMAQRPVGTDTLTLQAAFSLDPLMGKSGYPLLLQTGETANGVIPLIDRQHPHDFISELAGTYSHPVASDVSVFLYVGYPGEPALGPVTYLHRFAGMANPETPIDHHWLDSTHVTFGVVTAGVVKGPFKWEVSDFTGREPDQHRWNFDPARFDSWSTRLTYNPTPNWSLQVSYGYLHSPEQLDPNVNQRRTTASATYNRPFTGGTWQTTLAFGRDQNRPGHDLDAYLLESAARFGANTVFGRAENADKDELFIAPSPLAGRVYNVSKFSLGAYHTFQTAPHLALDLGGLVSKYALPSALNASYGSDPTSFMLFARAKID